MPVERHYVKIRRAGLSARHKMITAAIVFEFEYCISRAEKMLIRQTRVMKLPTVSNGKVIKRAIYKDSIMIMLYFGRVLFCFCILLSVLQCLELWPTF